MQHSFSQSGNMLVIALQGRLTFDDHTEFRQMLKQAASHTQTNWQLDVRMLEYIDSAGLGLLLRAKSHAEQGEKKITLKAPENGQVKDILDIAHFHQLFTYA